MHNLTETIRTIRGLSAGAVAREESRDDTCPVQIQRLRAILVAVGVLRQRIGSADTKSDLATMAAHQRRRETQPPVKDERDLPPKAVTSEHRAEIDRLREEIRCSRPESVPCPREQAEPGARS